MGISKEKEHRFDTRKTYLASSGNGTRRLPTGVEGVLALVVLRLLASRVDAWTHVGPGAVVERFLLQRISPFPYDLVGSSSFWYFILHSSRSPRLHRILTSTRTLTFSGVK